MLWPLPFLQVSFRSYWTRVLLEQLRNVKGDVSIKEMAEATMIRGQDIVDTLQSLGLIKYWKGTHLIHADPKVRAPGRGRAGFRSLGEAEEVWGARGEAEDGGWHKMQRLAACSGQGFTTTQTHGAGCCSSHTRTRAPHTPPTPFSPAAPLQVVQEHWSKYMHQRVIEVDPACLHWQPLPTTTARRRP